MIAPRVPPTSPPQPIQSSFSRRKSSSPLVPDRRKSTTPSLSSSDRSTSSAAALRLFQLQQQQEIDHQEPDDEEEQPAFLPSSPQTSRPSTATARQETQHQRKETRQESVVKENDSNPGSDSFSDLSDASISKSALEEALEEHLRRGESVVAGSDMQARGGVRSIWKGKFTG